MHKIRISMFKVHVVRGNILIWEISPGLLRRKQCPQQCVAFSRKYKRCRHNECICKPKVLPHIIIIDDWHNIFDKNVCVDFLDVATHSTPSAYSVQGVYVFKPY